MGKISLALLKDVNGALVPISGVNNSELMSCVKRGNISIDGDKLYGSDNFIIDAKRAKITINKLNVNSAMNTALEAELLNPDNLITDSLELDEFNSGNSGLFALALDVKQFSQEMSDSVLWGTNYTDTENQTWSLANRNSNKLIVKSKRLAETLYGSICIQNSNQNFAQTYNLYHMDKNRREVKIGEYWFDLFINSALDFIARGLQIDNNIPANSTDGNSFGAYLTSYLNTIKSGLGTAVASHIAGWTGNTTINSLLKISSNDTILSNTFIRLYSWLNVMNYISDNYEFEVYMPNGNHIPLYGITDNKVQLALFLASIMKYEWFIVVKQEYESQQGKLSLGYLNWTSYVLGFKCIDLVIQNHQFDNYDMGIGYVLFGKYNRVFPFDVIYSKFVKVNQSSKVKIGKVTTRTNLDQTQSGIPITEHGSFNISNDFIPCKRYYTLRNSTYYENASFPDFGEIKFVFDNVTPESLANIQDVETILSVTGYDSTSWMFFDHILCNERPLNLGEEAYYDNIPAFDEIDGSESDQYGLYIYDDFFDKYYTRRKSSLMSIYVKIYNDNAMLYFGIIDYNSVSVTKKEISFEATDAIGVMIENIKTLSSFVDFAQFGLAQNHIADKRSGSVLGEFVDEIISSGFPYKTRLVNPYFSIGNSAGLDYKLLESLSAEDAFIMALQCSKKILMVGSNGLICLKDQLDIPTDPKTLSAILSKEYNTSTDYEKFSIDKLKNIAKYYTFAPSIASFFNQFRKRYRKSINVVCYGILDTINLLDKISIGSDLYFVSSKSFDIFGNKTTLTLLEIE